MVSSTAPSSVTAAMPQLSAALSTNMGWAPILSRVSTAIEGASDWHNTKSPSVMSQKLSATLKASAKDLNSTKCVSGPRYFSISFIERSGHNTSLYVALNRSLKLIRSFADFLLVHNILHLSAHSMHRSFRSVRGLDLIDVLF